MNKGITKEMVLETLNMKGFERVASYRIAGILGTHTKKIDTLLDILEKKGLVEKEIVKSSNDKILAIYWSIIKGDNDGRATIPEQ